MKQPAIIVDIDGTLAHMSGRSPYEYTKVSTDTVDFVIKDMVNRYKDTHQVVIVSGRMHECYKDTTMWLIQNNIHCDRVFMRQQDDKREDSIIKREIYEKLIEPHYDVLFVLDDRNRVVKMWREIGLKCLQVADGNF